MLYIGIDCGVSGAIAIVDPIWGVKIHDCPLLPKNGRWNRHDPKAMLSLLPSGDTVAVVEHVRFDGRDDQHKTSVETLVRSHETWMTCLALRNVPTLDLEVAAWRKVVGATKLGTNEVAIVDYACRLYPQCADLLKRPSGRAKGKFAYEHNRAEALLMAHAARILDDGGYFDLKAIAQIIA